MSIGGSMSKSYTSRMAVKKGALRLLTASIGATALSVFSINVYAVPYEELIQKHSLANGIDPNLTIAVITRESAFKPTARSHKNAQGLMQVLPGTAKFMGVNPSNLYDPEQNIIAGTKYLAYLSRIFNGDLTKVLAGYNAGHGAVMKYNGIPPYKETQNYVRFVSNRYLALSEGGSSGYSYQAASYQPVSYKPVNYNANSNFQKPKMNDSEQQLYNSLNNGTTIFVRNY
jgi:soluble lytic murein transglycosylase-like protein|nr:MULTISPECIES: lytic transglycosylase domain-containing protein [Acinetobacter calcoaceticus/baumannii complex]